MMDLASKLFTINHLHQNNDFLFSLATEVWELKANDTSGIIRPELSDGNYRYGIGMYAVDFDFCR